MSVGALISDVVPAIPSQGSKIGRESLRYLKACQRHIDAVTDKTKPSQWAAEIERLVQKKAAAASGGGSAANRKVKQDQVNPWTKTWTACKFKTRK